MTVIAVGSIKGSPGVTTLAMALAASWPRERVLLAEVDPAGGDLASRFRLPPEPGLVSLAMVARRDWRPELIFEHCHRLPGDLLVLPAPASSEQAPWAVGVIAERAVPNLAAAQNVDVIADCGRLDTASPALPIARTGRVLVLVARPQLAELNHLGARLPGLGAGAAEVCLVLVGRGAWNASEVSQAMGIPVVGEVPVDGAGASLLAGAGRNGVRSARRLPLVRGARTIAERLASRLATSMNAGAPASTAPPTPAPRPRSAAEAAS